jgi:3-hydroxyisobutyrate dehydrogenase-like beta-hydroxyacid dehydrogenase
MNIGFIGLGLMGRGMAANLLGAGHHVRVLDIDRGAGGPLEAQGARWAANPAAAAKGAELVFTCLPGPAEVERIALGEEGLLAAMERGAAWFDFTTSSPELVRRLHAAFAAKGIHVLDAPVSGGPAGAQSRKLAFWVGGDRVVYDKYLDVLRAMGEEPMHVGAVGCGVITKLAHNCANFTVQAVLAEAFTLGVKAGVDPLMLFTALRQGTLGKSRTFDRLAEQFLPGSYDPAAFALKHAHKDMSLAASVAAAHGVPLRMAEIASADMAEAIARGWGDRDARIALTLQEERAGVSVRIDSGKLRNALRG